MTDDRMDQATPEPGTEFSIGASITPTSKPAKSARGSPHSKSRRNTPNE